MKMMTLLLMMIFSFVAMASEASGLDKFIEGGQTIQHEGINREE